MKTSERFSNAVTKLYNAFHNGELNAMDCEKCAVGNIVGSSNWTLEASILDFNIEKGQEDIYNICNTGYSAKELRNVERVFMHGHKVFGGEKTYSDHWLDEESTKDEQFKGLCAVVEYLCELEGIPNVMDYTCLFETENDEPKHQLTEVF